MLDKHIFISYATVDREFVKKLTADLQSYGVNVWIDQLNLKPFTANWEQALRDAIEASYAVLLVASPASRRSDYVQDELAIARMVNRPIYPVWAEGEDHAWPDCIPMGFGKVQRIDARGVERYNAAVPLIVESLIGKGIPPASHIEETLKPTTISPGFQPRNPYKGLRAFRQIDQVDFFGRDALVQSLLESLQTILAADDARLLAVLGASGSGKSSVVMAGLLPKLQRNALSGSDHWHYLPTLLLGSDPIENLASTLKSALPETSFRAILEDLEDPSTRGLHRLVQHVVQTQDAGQVLLFVDQFEELFTQTSDERKRQQFIDLLVTAVTEPNGALIVLLTLRADFFHRPMDYPQLGKLLERNSRSVLPMSLSDLYDVIQQPAALDDVRLNFDDGLVAELVFDVRDQIGALPLLQFALDQLYERRNGQRLTNAAYREIGGVRGALAKHAEATYNGLPSDEYRTLARALFLRLIEPGATEQDTTRRRADLRELVLTDDTESTIMQSVSKQFVQARLLQTDKSGDTTTIEVSHEALIREWMRLSDWLHTAREDVRIQQEVSKDAHEWLVRGQLDDLLYRGVKLAEARDWAARNYPSQHELAFIESARLTEQTQRKQADRSRIFYEMLREASAEVSLPEIANVFTVGLNSIFSSSATIIYIIETVSSDKDLNHQILRPVAFSSSHLITSEHELSSVSLEGSTNLLSLLAQNPEIIVLDDIQQHTSYLPINSLTQAVMIIPIKDEREFFGMIVIEGMYNEQFDDSDLGFVQTTADSLASLVQNGRLFEALTSANEDLRDLDRFKSDFLANMSHELRTPINSIIGFSKVMLKGIDGPLTEMQEQDLTTIYNSGQHLLTLLNDILDQAKIAAGKMDMKFDYFEMKTVIEAVRSIGIGLIKDKNISLNLEIANNLPTAYGDEFRTRQILINLVSNAAKFTHEGAIWIRAYPTSIDSMTRIRIDIQDTGIGIYEKDIPFLFEKYPQIDSSLTRTEGGTGLGLSIVKSLTELQGGEIGVTSEVGKGSTFWFTIPTQPPQAE